MAIFQIPQSIVPTNLLTNGSATVATSQTTTSTSYTDLTTSGPAATVLTGTRALVIVTAQMNNGNGGAFCYMGYAVSGATTTSAADATAVSLEQNGASGGQSQDVRISAASIASLTPGSNTFTAKYRVTAGTGTFLNREIIVINLS